MKTICAILTLLLLSACCTPIQPEQVLVPVPVPCTTETPKEPSYRFMPPYDNIFDAVRDLLGDREVSKAHTVELEAALKSCK